MLAYYEEKIQQINNNYNKYATVFYFENNNNYLVLKLSEIHCMNNLLRILETKSKIYLASWILSQHYRKNIWYRKAFPFLKIDQVMKKSYKLG